MRNVDLTLPDTMMSSLPMTIAARGVTTTFPSLKPATWLAAKPHVNEENNQELWVRAWGRY